MARTTGCAGQTSGRLAATAGLMAAEADAAIDDMIERTKQMADRITLPKVPYYGPEGEAMAAKMLKLCRTRIESLGLTKS